MRSLDPGRDFRSSLNSEGHKISLRVFLYQPETIFKNALYGKKEEKSLCYPRLGDEISIPA